MGEKSQETEDTSSEQATALSWVVQERLKPLLDLITDTDVEELSPRTGRCAGSDQAHSADGVHSVVAPTANS